MNTPIYRYIYALFIAAALFLMVVSSASAGVIAMPSTLTVARGESASRSITYRFIDVPPGTYISQGGEFLVGGEIIGSNNVSVITSSDAATEALVVPSTVIERALSMRSNMMTYHRYFTNGFDILYEIDVQILITSEAGSDFEVKRLELYFANRRAETTVHRNDKGLRAYVEMRYAGSGIFQAYWEVDGRVLATINRHLMSAGSITLESPDIPALPTFDPGSHVVRFVVTGPSNSLTVPSIVYFVLPEESDAAGIDLLLPVEGQVLEGQPRNFRWAGSALANTYFICYFEDPEADPVFSAYTDKTTYSLPAGLPDGVMVQGGRYFWSVSALDAEGKLVGQSAVRSFMLK